MNPGDSHRPGAARRAASKCRDSPHRVVVFENKRHLVRVQTYTRADRRRQRLLQLVRAHHPLSPTTSRCGLEVRSVSHETTVGLRYALRQRNFGTPARQPD